MLKNMEDVINVLVSFNAAGFNIPLSVIWLLFQLYTLVKEICEFIFIIAYNFIQIIIILLLCFVDIS